MELSDKQYLIEQSIELGMSKYDSYLLAGVTEREREIIEKDTDFQSYIDILVKRKEQKLLQMYYDNLDLSVSKGNLTSIQWMLSRLNPEKWGNQIVTNKNLNINVEKKYDKLTEEEKQRIDEEYQNILNKL